MKGGSKRNRACFFGWRTFANCLSKKKGRPEEEKAKKFKGSADFGPTGLGA